MNLANSLVAAGHRVVLWSSAFYHQEKRHRCRTFETIDVSDRLKIHLVPSSGYSRNIGPGRLFDHAELGYNLSKILHSDDFEKPDVAFVGFPPIETAAVMTKWLKAEKVPVMLDAKDQWPTIFAEPFPKVMHWFFRIVLHPYFHFAIRAMRDADAFCAMSDDFVDWMYNVSGREKSKYDYVAPLTSPKMVFSQEVTESSLLWCRNKGITVEKQSLFSFFGNISKGFDFSVVRDLAERCLAEKTDCQFVICGDGAAGKDVREMMAGLGNVIMTGWIDAPKIAVISGCSLATLAPYINNDAFKRSIPNKIIDSLANGLPIITTLKGRVGRLIDEYGLGYSGGSLDEMYEFAEKLIVDRGYGSELSARAASVYESFFSYEKIYGGLVKALEKMVKNDRRKAD